MACQLDLAGWRCDGLVLNVSSRGLFVETRAKAPYEPNVVVAVEMALPRFVAPLALQTVVVRQFWVPDSLLALAQGGMGLSIRRASGAWSELLADLGGTRPLVPLGREAMAPLRQLPRTRCRRCKREHAAASAVCSWCWEP